MTMLRIHFLYFCADLTEYPIHYAHGCVLLAFLAGLFKLYRTFPHNIAMA